jgi:hypothetical protein
MTRFADHAVQLPASMSTGLNASPAAMQSQGPCMNSRVSLSCLPWLCVGWFVFTSAELAFVIQVVVVLIWQVFLALKAARSIRTSNHTRLASAMDGTCHRLRFSLKVRA